MILVGGYREKRYFSTHSRGSAFCDIYERVLNALSYFILRGESNLIPINKEEAIAIRKRYPESHVRRCNQQKSRRHHYWGTEEPCVLELLRRLRQKNIVAHYE